MPNLFSNYYGTHSFVIFAQHGELWRFVATGGVRWRHLSVVSKILYYHTYLPEYNPIKDTISQIRLHPMNFIETWVFIIFNSTVKSNL